MSDSRFVPNQPEEGEVSPEVPAVKRTRRQEIGAVWIKVSRTGEKYLRIKLTQNGQETFLTAFSNRFKDSSNAKPHFVIYEDSPKDAGIDEIGQL